MHMKKRLSEIQEKIRLYNMQITENEQKIRKLQEELTVREAGKVECRTNSVSQRGIQAGITEKYYGAL